MYHIAKIGAIAGFTYFIISLESEGMGNVIIRCGKFNPGGIIHFMKSPFKQRYLWYPVVWKNNWIITTSIGFILGYALEKGLEFILS